jgi:hypothetical protein
MVYTDSARRSWICLYLEMDTLNFLLFFFFFFFDFPPAKRVLSTRSSKSPRI